MLHLVPNLLMAFGSLCFQLADSQLPANCLATCVCADDVCDRARLSITFLDGQKSADLAYPLSQSVESSVDGINQERIFHLQSPEESLRVRQTLYGAGLPKVLSIRYRSQGEELYCAD